MQELYMTNREGISRAEAEQMIDNLLAHIVITVLNHQLNVAVRVQAFPDFFGNFHYLALTRLKRFAVKIANDVMHLRAFNGAFDAGKVVETFITLGVFRRFPNR